MRLKFRKRKFSRQHGMSFIEGLTVLLIIAILLASATPPLQGIVQRAEAQENFHTVLASLNLARSYAISKKVISTYCPSVDGISCGGAWSEGTILFGDVNNDRVLDEDEHLVERGAKFSGAATLEWRASAGRNGYIRFSPSGAAREFGTFTYCAGTGTASHDRLLVINRMGRVRIPQDENGDGLIDDDGRRPVCPP